MFSLINSGSQSQIGTVLLIYCFLQGDDVNYVIAKQRQAMAVTMQTRTSRPNGNQHSVKMTMNSQVHLNIHG